MASDNKYTCIVKVGNNTFLKYRLSDLLSFVKFLDQNHSEWRYFNVFDKLTKEQIASFTKNNRPTSKHI